MILFPLNNTEAASLRSIKAFSINSVDSTNIDNDFKKDIKVKNKKKRNRRGDVSVVSRDSQTISTAQGADKVRLIVDSLRKAGIRIDSLQSDSLSRKLFSDSVVVKSGVLPRINTAGSISNARLLDSIIFAERLAANRVAEKEAKNRANIFKDSIAFSRFGILTTILPGYGQIYNKDYWKLPVLYGGVAAFVWGGVETGQRAKHYETLFNNAVDSKQQQQVDYYYGKHRDYKTTSTLLYVGAAATYMAFMADAAFGYKWKEDSKSKATYLALMFPGAGQLYNKQYWKLPIVYGGFATMAYIINFNGRGYNRYLKAYDAVTSGKPDEFDGYYTAETLRNTKNKFRRARDLAIFYTAGFYLLTVVDAYVSASFKQYDISDDLALQVAPSLDFNQGYSTRASNPNNGSFGVSLKLTF